MVSSPKLEIMKSYLKTILKELTLDFVKNKQMLKKERIKKKVKKTMKNKW